VRNGDDSVHSTVQQNFGFRTVCLFGCAAHDLFHNTDDHLQAVK
jgi:hypothetical protein